MTYVEHYFENLVLLGEDVSGEFNKNALSPEVQRAVEECAQHLCYSLFTSREEFVKACNSQDEQTTKIYLIDRMTDEELTEFVTRMTKIVARVKEQAKDI